MLTKSCKYCGKGFNKSPTKSMRAWIDEAKFCSRKCQRSVNLNSRHGKSWNKGLTKDDPRVAKQLKKFTTRGLKGLNTGFKVNPYKGERHWNWKGGKTKLIERIRGMGKYFDWRKDIFERDNYICQVCGKTESGNLHVDHIENLSKLLIKYQIKNIEEAFVCGALWERNNGRTLCSSCHYLVTWGREKPKDLIWGWEKRNRKRDVYV